jgi:NADPH:quinone reductase-like Zn-dependent oxidoreductase
MVAVPPGSNGANAEYVCVSEDEVLSKPANMTYEEAAAVPTAATVALWFLREGGLQRGQRVLINGASGGLGTFAVQIAKSLNAEVTAVCSTANLEMVHSLGANEVIDYSKEDFTKMGQTYDVIFDAVGKNSFPNCKSSLNRKGTYISTMVTFQGILHMIRTSFLGSKKAKVKIAKPSIEDLSLVNDLVKIGKVKSIIDRIYSLEQVAEAHRYAETGRAKGKIIVSVAGES